MTAERTGDGREPREAAADRGLARRLAGAGRSPLLAAGLLGLALLGLAALLNWQSGLRAGLTEAVARDAGGDRVQWRGVAYVPSADVFDLRLGGGGHVIWLIDGRLADEASSVDQAGRVRTVLLSAGFHEIEIDREAQGRVPSVQAFWAPAGGLLKPLESSTFLQRAPASPRLAAGLLRFAGLLRLLGLTSLAVCALLGIRGLAERAQPAFARLAAGARMRTVGRVLAVALPIAVIGYGAALRIDALTLRYGPVKSPAWLQALQRRAVGVRGIRPASLDWQPESLYPHRDGPPSRYISDPYTYLTFARQMRSFYAAHYREPLFPFATKLFLRLLNDQDVAVSFASATFSVLTLVATFLLGRLAFSWWVGLGAAAAMAIEYDVISAGVSGWRDEAFAFTVVLFAYALLRWVRAPARSRALAIGICAGAACLVRITALSFVVPALAVLPFAAGAGLRRRALGDAGLAVLALSIVAGPYVFNCWRAFGDPLYAINFHTGAYLATEGRQPASEPSAAAYVEAKAAGAPFRTLDTLVMGLTSYPFSNKWHGFDPWSPRLGEWLSWAALAGLVLWTGTTDGRLLLLVLSSSLLPFAVTWTLIWDWRFTEHAYPFFLLAACAAVGQAVTWLIAPRRIGTAMPRGARRRRVLVWTATLASIAASVLIVVGVLPVLTRWETLRAGEPVSIGAGGRDASFFGRGWSRPFAAGSVTRRVSQGASPEMELPLPRSDEYDLVLRVDPFPSPLGGGRASLSTLRVGLNGQAVGAIPLAWNPERVGSYDVHLDRAVVKAGLNRLTLTLEPGASSEGPPAPGISDGAAFQLWYVRIRPAASRTP